MEKIFQIPIQLCLTSLWLAVVVNPVMADSVQPDSVKDPMAVSESAVSESLPSLKVVNELISNTDEDGSKDVSAGDTLNYSIVATNTGTVNLTNVTVEDDLVKSITPFASLPPFTSIFSSWNVRPRKSSPIRLTLEALALIA